MVRVFRRNSSIPFLFSLLARNVVAVAAKQPFKVRIHVSKLQGKTLESGDTSISGFFDIEVFPEWAPLGAARIREIVDNKVWHTARFFRVIAGYVVQWGIPGKPALSETWSQAMIKDDPMKKNVSNLRGYVSFATSGRNARTTQVFINLKDNIGLDRMEFSPFGRVVEGLDIVERIVNKHREKPDQDAIEHSGNKYLRAEYPDLTFIKKVAYVTNATTTTTTMPAVGQPPFKIRIDCGRLEGVTSSTAAEGDVSSTTQISGSFTIEVRPDWAPIGAARIREVVEQKLWKLGRFYRVLPSFIVQWGLPASPELAGVWTERRIKDDPMKQDVRNTNGTVSFVMLGVDTRTVEVFINLRSNTNFDSEVTPPFGKVVDGWDIVERIVGEHRDKPDRERIEAEGAEYLRKNFPDMSYIRNVVFVDDDGKEVEAGPAKKTEL